MAKNAAKAAAKGGAVPKPADVRAAAEEQTPLEPIGPGVEHEDHEGGATDSLARKGVRGSVTPEEIEEADEAIRKAGAIRGPSVRDRQAITAAAIRQGGMGAIDRGETDEEGNVTRAPVRGAMAAQAAKKGAKVLMVKAVEVGHYPADGRLRAPGEVFPYVYTPEEQAKLGKLPSWVEPVGSASSLERRSRDDLSTDINAPLVIEVQGAGTGASARVRHGTTGARRDVI